jgi:hypothetical protein
MVATDITIQNQALQDRASRQDGMESSPRYVDLGKCEVLEVWEI